MPSARRKLARASRSGRWSSGATQVSLIVASLPWAGPIHAASSELGGANIARSEPPGSSLPGCDRPALEVCRSAYRPTAAACRRLRDQRLAKRASDGVSARVRLELGHRLLYVRAHGERRDRELARDLLVPHPVGEEAQNLALALRQGRQPLGRLRPGQQAGERRIDVGAPLADDPDRA